MAKGATVEKEALRTMTFDLQPGLHRRMPQLEGVTAHPSHSQNLSLIRKKNPPRRQGHRWNR
jgi:hypothetical protein